jgi:hypothetical protein
VCNEKICSTVYGHDVAGYVFIKTSGIFFLKLRGKRGMFFYWAGSKRDTGGVFQLLETQLASIQNPAFLQISYEKFSIRQAKFGVKKQFY